tara:strand:- start:5690 stop:5938 length:249 start_codon:yes stop_codon:yes gene_type:complete
MENPLSHPSVPYDAAVNGPGTTVWLLLDLGDHQDRRVLREAEDWLLDLAPGTWGRWADPERQFWSFQFADDVYAVQFTLMFK